MGVPSLLGRTVWPPPAARTRGHGGAVALSRALWPPPAANIRGHRGAAAPEEGGAVISSGSLYAGQAVGKRRKGKLAMPIPATGHGRTIDAAARTLEQLAHDLRVCVYGTVGHDVARLNSSTAK